MYQLNVYLAPGQLTYKGHPITGWDRKKEGKATRFHPEFFDSVSAMETRRQYWEDRGVKVETGKLSAKVMR